MVKIGAVPCTCSCGWSGRVYDCVPGVGGERRLGCPSCGAVVKASLSEAERRSVDVVLQFAGQRAGVRLAPPDTQEILLAWEGRSGLLAMLLAGPAPLPSEWHDDEEFAVVRHDEQVDVLLVELIEFLIDLRYLHPTMVQLPLLDMDEEELAEELGGAE